MPAAPTASCAAQDTGASCRVPRGRPSTEHGSRWRCNNRASATVHPPRCKHSAPLTVRSGPHHVLRPPFPPSLNPRRCSVTPRHQSLCYSHPIGLPWVTRIYWHFLCMKCLYKTHFLGIPKGCILAQPKATSVRSAFNYRSFNEAGRKADCVITRAIDQSLDETWLLTSCGTLTSRRNSVFNIRKARARLEEICLYKLLSPLSPLEYNFLAPSLLMP